MVAQLKNLATHKDIAVHSGVTEAAAQRWGRTGKLGTALISYPAHYDRTDAFKRAKALVNKDGRKLTNKQVREIKRRRARGETNVALAEDFGISEPYVSMLINGKRRADA